MRKRGVGTGIVIGAAAAFGLTSETARSTRIYWWLSDRVVTPLLRKIPDPELSHKITLGLLKAKLGPVSKHEKSSALENRVFGLSFASPLGLAAGFDKQANVYDEMLEMGFSFVEIGGVTPQPQTGNPKPRVFRLLEDEAIINRIGLSSEGHAAVANRLKSRDRSKGLIGINLAKNTVSNSPSLASDYVLGVEVLGPLCDFIVLNVSCPNVQYTKDLKNDDLLDLVSKVRKTRDRVCENTPLLVKIGPDMNDGAKQKIAAIALECGVDGLIISNTTSTRPENISSSLRTETGGLSGQPLKYLALETTRDIYRLTDGAIPIIGVGGIATGEDAYQRIRAGASLLQVYTALVYDGPGIINRIQKDLEALMRKDGYTNITQCIGVDVKKKEMNDN